MVRIKSCLVVMIVIIALLLSVTRAWAEETEEASGIRFDFSGSLEAGKIVQEKNDDMFLFALFPPGSIDFPNEGSYVSLRNDVQIIPNDHLKVKLRLSYVNNTTATDSPQNDTLALSRGFIDYSPSGVFSLRLGKQRLAWGTGYAWNPTDLLDLPRNAFTASDDPEGITAVRTDLKLGPVSGQLVLTPNYPDYDWETTGKAIRFKASPGGVDLTLGWVDPTIGSEAKTLDFAASIAGIGFHGEAAYQSEGNRRADKADILNYLLGIDYNFPGGFIVALEYYHNDTAFADAAEAQGFIVTSLIADPTGFNPMDYLTNLANNGGVTRDHYFLRCSKSFGENTNTELLLVYNATDSSLAAQPKFEYTWKQTTTLYIKGLVTQGDADSEINLLPIAAQWQMGLKIIF
ncbi:MAG TPA: hypothetical protein VHY08_19740 [Bacillota bacterium]|nr:hypothetical protein [Bacillota bacterium]